MCQNKNTFSKKKRLVNSVVKFSEYIFSSIFRTFASLCKGSLPVNQYSEVLLYYEL
jgi:hypothetical protein